MICLNSSQHHQQLWVILCCLSEKGRTFLHKNMLWVHTWSVSLRPFLGVPTRYVFVEMLWVFNLALLTYEGETLKNQPNISGWDRSLLFQCNCPLGWCTWTNSVPVPSAQKWRSRGPCLWLTPQLPPRLLCWMGNDIHGYPFSSLEIGTSH